MTKPKEFQTTTQIIAREGFKPILIFIFLGILFIFFHLNVAALICFSISFLCAFIFRNTERIPQIREKTSIIAPCDGLIKDIVFQNNITILTIKMNAFDNGILRTPTFLDSMQARFRYGLFIKEKCALKEILNAKHAIYGIAGDKNIWELTLLPEAWNKANIYQKDSCYLGERIGFMKYGFCILKINQSSEILAKIGDKIFAGETQIGRFYEN